MSKISISEPVKCHLWNLPLTKNSLNYCFDFIKNYIDEDHFDHSLYKCKTCGQLYFMEFSERVNFDKEDDDVFYTYIPVDNEESADELNNLWGLELTGFLRLSHFKPPFDSIPVWINRK